ncbi:flagellar export chaperone FliS [Sansalvadorimonas sp. 2012CJ34-2]|uniref:Flagellar secretion chaperone FliS n=1 Tax=Parendozoicomonas callyspongiae TaxID=2942213 RepID=A0ABT0PFD4_9GAMM|nr:flagellar export chaperone FliS [Sansalvadorimonas sp. 2012CJ34-2]MCL6270087.1 flagellar export chaperone FliS [Sansalvadorimonas sp. 2012CJ34-2]
MKYQQAMNAYTQNQVQNRAAVASPYRLVQMMFEKLLDHIASAGGAIDRKDIAEKGNHIGKALQLLGALRSALDLEVGGEVAVNLSRLYEFCSDTLMQASLKNDKQKIEDAAGIIRDIKSAWDQLEHASNG